MLTATSSYTPRPGAVEQIVSRVAAAVTTSAEQVANDVLETAQGIVPVRSGDLRDSGHTVLTQEQGAVSAAVVFDSDHAAFVEFGTGQRGASSPGAGPGPYNDAWPGMEAQPYLRPAFEAKRTEVEGEVQKAVESAIR